MVVADISVAEIVVVQNLNCLQAADQFLENGSKVRVIVFFVANFHLAYLVKQRLAAYEFEHPNVIARIVDQRLSLHETRITCDQPKHLALLFGAAIARDTIRSKMGHEFLIELKLNNYLVAAV